MSTAWRTKMWGHITTVTTLVCVSMLCCLLYWSIIGYSLDRSIQAHIERCEKQLKDPTTQMCVVAFIPIPRNAS